MTIHLTRPDAAWLAKLLVICLYIHKEYPELFTKDDEEALKIAQELIRSINQ